MNTLFIPIIQHYRNQGLQEAYRFIGRFDIIGNPVQLVMKMKIIINDIINDNIMVMHI